MNPDNESGVEQADVACPPRKCDFPRSLFTPGVWTMRTIVALLGLVWLVIGDAADIQPDPVYRETEVRQSRPRLNGEVFDRQESDPTLKDKFAIADRKAERVVGNVERDSKFILHFWRAKKRILKDQFGIQWTTPAELNPSIKYASYGQPEITETEDRALRALTASRLSGSSEQVRGVDRNFEELRASGHEIIRPSRSESMGSRVTMNLGPSSRLRSGKND